MASSGRKRDFDFVDNILSEPISNLPKRQKFERNDEKLQNFLDWCLREGFRISSKVSVTDVGSCAQYGMVAIDSINAGDVLFEIPRSALLMPTNSSIPELLKTEIDQIQSDSGWVPLLLVLMFEYSNDNSRWRHYVQLVPDFNELDLPMFWSREELMKELAGTGIPEAVDKDLTSMKDEFSNVVLPFIKKHSTHFPAICQSLEFYKKMVAFVMAYSFTEPSHGAEVDDGDSSDEEDSQKSSPPMMVPVADILNHVTNNNAHLVFEKDYLTMVATRAIKTGEEIYNTYGELASGSLLHMYGFAEPPPSGKFETVDLSINVIHDVITNHFSPSDRSFVQKKWKFLTDIGCITEDGVFVVGETGILTDESMFQLLKVMVMDRQDFEQYKENDGWSSEEDGSKIAEEAKSMTFDDISKLPSTWKQILLRIATACMERYPRSLEEEESELARALSEQTWTKRQMFSAYVRIGQLGLLNRLKSICT